MALGCSRHMTHLFVQFTIKSEKKKKDKHVTLHSQKRGKLQQKDLPGKVYKFCLVG